MHDAVTREFKSIRRELDLLDRATGRHFEARIDNMEKRIVSDLANAQRQMEGLRAELKDAIEANATQIAALQRGEAGSSGAESAKDKTASRLDTWKLAALGFLVTAVVFVANLLTSGR